MQCRKCHRGANEINGYLHRVNEKGVPGIWECRPFCLTDISPDEALTRAVIGEPSGETELRECPLKHEPQYLVGGRLHPERGVIARDSGQLTETATIGGGYVRCLDCGLTVEAHNRFEIQDGVKVLVKATRADAIKIWNTRATPQQSASEGERFEAWWDEYQQPYLPNGRAGYGAAKDAWLAALAERPDKQKGGNHEVS